MKQYEMLFILPNQYTDDEIPQVLKTVENVITEKNGVIENTKSIGKKKFAYPIKHQNHGHYFLTYFEAEPQDVVAMGKPLNLMPELLRHLIVYRVDTGLSPEKQAELNGNDGKDEIIPEPRKPAQPKADIVAEIEEKEEVKKEVKTEEPKEEIKAEEPKTEEPKEEVKAEEPKTEEPKEEIKTEEPKTEEPKEEIKAEEPKTEEPKEEIKAEEPKTEEKKDAPKKQKATLEELDKKLDDILKDIKL